MKIKKLIISVLILTLLIVPTVSMANSYNYTYTALGDSIPFGLGATGFYSYTDMLDEHFTKIHGEGMYNRWAVSGETSSSLLAKLPGMMPALSQSNYITLMVGSNDLLSVAISVIGTYPQFGDPEYVATQLALFQEWKLLPPGSPLLPGMDPVFVAVMGQFKAAVGGFALNWHLINGALQSTGAKVIVSTIYNPFKSEPALHALAEPFIQAMNRVINNNMVTYGYSVADTYTKFEEYNNPNKILVCDEFVISPLCVYLHPKDRGQKMIFNLHKDQLDD